MKHRLGYFLLLFLSIYLFAFDSSAQESATNETNPPSLKWYQVNTSHFRILYPKGFETQAQRMANTLEYIHNPEAKSMGGKARKISVILQNQSSLSNAFVTIVPRRSEFYTMPSQNYNFVGNNDWLNLLASHEYRHVVQFQHATRGFNRLIYYLFGSNVLAGMDYVAAPQWFWEGDAVATETAFTQAGRGRIPNFDLVFRTNLQEGRVFNYHKQYLRSYKNNIQDHYVLGYHMISYLRKKTGDKDIWSRVTGRSWSVPFIPFAFSNALKKETGMYVTALYREMAAALQKEWKQQQDSLTLTSFKVVNPRATTAYTDYKYPQELEDGSVVAQKSGIGDIEQLVVLKDGQEKVMYTQGILNDAGMMSAANSRVVWNEFRFDPRWLVRTYSVVVGYDLGSKTKKVFSRGSRYAAAAISPDGYKVATVRTGTDYQTRLIVLDYFTGKVIKEFDNPDNDFISMPRWNTEGTQITALKTNKKGKAITRFDFENGTNEDLTPFRSENIGHPVPFDHYVIYNSPVSGIDNLYALDVTTGSRYQLTCSRYGAYNAALSRDGKTIYYNEQTRDGLDVVKIPFEPSTWKPRTQQDQPTSQFQHLVNQEAHAHLFDSIPQQTLPVKKYSRLTGIINPYGWGGYFDTSLTRANVGISSQDLLSTTTINAGYVFDLNERTGAWQGSVSYQGQFPIVDVTVTQANRSVDKGDINYAKVVGKDTTRVIDDLKFQWKEQTIQAGLRIPLVTTTSKYYGNFTFSDYVGYTRVTNFSNSIDGGGRLLPTSYPQYLFRDYQDNGNLIYNQFTISAYRLLKQSRRDINSKWGQTIYMNIYNTPFGGDFSGTQFSFYGVGYFPGLAKHHSLWGYWGYQYSQIPAAYLKTGQGLDNYTFRNQIPLPRGQSISRFQDFYSMSANYTLPLWYPDIALGPILNIQRVRANAFFDYAFGSSVYTKTYTQTYTTVGGEVKFDINVMRLLPQFNIGFRYSKGLTPSVSKFELLIGTLNF